MGLGLFLPFGGFFRRGGDRGLAGLHALSKDAARQRGQLLVLELSLSEKGHLGVRMANLYGMNLLGDTSSSGHILSLITGLDEISEQQPCKFYQEDCRMQGESCPPRNRLVMGGKKRVKRCRGERARRRGQGQDVGQAGQERT